MRTLLLSLVFIISACGYAPFSKVTSASLDKEVDVRIIINKAEPKNSITLADNFTNYLQHYLHKTISKEANTIITLSLIKSDFIPLYYDELGYTRSYKAAVKLEFKLTKEKSVKIIITEGEYIFNTNSISVISEEQKSKAIEEASKKAFDEFAMQIIE